VAPCFLDTVYMYTFNRFATGVYTATVRVCFETEIQETTKNSGVSITNSSNCRMTTIICRLMKVVSKLCSCSYSVRLLSVMTVSWLHVDFTVVFEHIVYHRDQLSLLQMFWSRQTHTMANLFIHIALLIFMSQYRARYGERDRWGQGHGPHNNLGKAPRPPLAIVPKPRFGLQYFFPWRPLWSTCKDLF